MPSQLAHHRDEDHHHRRVVHERRRHGRAAEERDEGDPGPVIGEGERPAGERVHRPGAHQRAREDEHRADRDRRAVREGRERVVAGHIAQRQIRRRTQDRDHGGREALDQEPGERDAEHDQRDDDSMFLEEVKQRPQT